MRLLNSPAFCATAYLGSILLFALIYQVFKIDIINPYARYDPIHTELRDEIASELRNRLNKVADGIDIITNPTFNDIHIYYSETGDLEGRVLVEFDKPGKPYWRTDFFFGNHPPGKDVFSFNMKIIINPLTPDSLIILIVHGEIYTQNLVSLNGKDPAVSESNDFPMVLYLFETDDFSDYDASHGRIRVKTPFGWDAVRPGRRFDEGQYEILTLEQHDSAGQDARTMLRLYDGERIVEKIRAWRLDATGVVQHEWSQLWRMIYFSVVTATTLGYGDFIPVSRGARIIVIIQTIFSVCMIGLFLNALAHKASIRN